LLGSLRRSAPIRADGSSIRIAASGRVASWPSARGETAPPRRRSYVRSVSALPRSDHDAAEPTVGSATSVGRDGYRSQNPGGQGNVRPPGQVETAALSAQECGAEGMQRRLPGIVETVAARTWVMNGAAAARGARRRVAVDVVAARRLVLLKRLLWQFGALGERRQRCAGARGQKKQAREPSLHHSTRKFR
jgi:hypothetical protein